VVTELISIRLRIFFPGKRTISDLTLAELTSPAVVIDVIKKCEANPDYELTVNDITNWEFTFGPIPEKALVCMRTGWSKRFSDEKAYRNLQAGPPNPAYKEVGGTMHFPGFSEASAHFLLKERSINGIGIDTLSLDPGRSETFPVHMAMLQNDRYQIENMKLDQVPESSAVIIAMPLNIASAPECPTRVLALVPTVIPRAVTEAVSST